VFSTKKISFDQKVTRGEGTDYVIDNYITSEFSTHVSLAISHLKGELWPTKNIVSDRIYFFLKGEGHFVFEDGCEIDVKEGDALLVHRFLNNSILDCDSTRHFIHFFHFISPCK